MSRSAFDQLKGYLPKCAYHYEIKHFICGKILRTLFYMRSVLVVGQTKRADPPE